MPNLFFCSLRIKKGDVEAEFGMLVKRVRDASADTVKQEDLKAQMEKFLEVRKPSVKYFSPACLNLNGDRIFLCFYFHLGG